MKKAVFWFRRDLRIEDNRGLFEALSSNHKVIPIFIFDKEILQRFTNPTDLRVKFIYEQILSLQKVLAEHGGNLRVFYSTPAEVFEKIANEENIEAVFCNRDYEPTSIKRDLVVQDILFKNRVSFHTFKDHLIFEGNEILKADGKPYTVFTPFKNKWLAAFTSKDCAHFQSKKLLHNLVQEKTSQIPELQDMGYEKLNPFNFPVAQISKKLLSDYDKNRDIPILNATSLQGVHLRFGTVSIRKYVKEARKINETWLSELIWREFFSQILFHFPEVVTLEFKEKYRSIKWKKDKKLFQAWADGKTGYPIVDAGMRELNATGYIHNRVRMITASFLIKDLQINWRMGENYFAEKLLDYDLASNNGNWQWASSSGCDAAPYFRIFNPYSQQEKFDPDFLYIKKWVPEYNTDAYPRPIVDHKIAREETLRLYKESLG